MPETATLPAPTKPRRSRWRRFLRWAGIVLLVLAVFHRPLFHFTARIALHLVAARMHLALDLHTSGTIFTNLTIHELHARANGTGTTPVRSIDIAQIRLDYSLPTLIRRGVGEFLHSYEIHHATLDIEALPSASKAEHKEKVAIAQQLNDVLGQPAAYSDRVFIEDFNITVRAPENVTEVKGFNLFLDPEKPGYLRIGLLAIPGVPRWENLAASTSYEARNFFIRDLRFAPELKLSEVNFDASQRAQNKGSMMLKAEAFGGTFELHLAGSQLNKPGENLENAYHTTLTIAAAGVALDRAAAYFGAPAPPVRTLRGLDVHFTGEPEQPRTWRGDLGLSAGTIAAGTLNLDGATLRVSCKDGHAEIATAEVTAGSNRIGLTGTVGLPASVNDFDKSEVDATLRVAAADLPAVVPATPETAINGDLHGGGPITLHAGVLRTEIGLEASDLTAKDLSLQSAKFSLRAEKQVNPPTATAFEGLEAKLTGELSALRFQTINVDSVRVDVEARNELVKLHGLEIHQGENAITAEGSARLPKDQQPPDQWPIDARMSIHLPALETFGVVVNHQTLKGRIEGNGEVHVTGGALTGGLQIDGSDFLLGKFKTDRLAAKVNIAEHQAVIEQLALAFQGGGQIVLTGKSGLAPPYAYEGGLLVDVQNLTTLRPLLEVFGNEQNLSGAFSAQWNGRGEIQPQSHSGQLDIALNKGKFGTIDLTQIHVAGSYTPEFAETKELKFVSGATSLTGAVEFRENRLRLKDLNLQQGSVSVLTGFVLAPFDPNNPKQPVALDQRIAANVNTNKLDLDKLLGSFGMPSPVSGAITANLVAGGTLAEPFAHLRVNGERLQAKAEKKLAPATLALDLHYSNKEATLAATVQQPQIQPLTIKGHAPLDLDAAAKSGKIDPNLPLELAVDLPPSSLAFLPSIVPAVRRVDGTAAIGVHVAGTMQKPALSGGLRVELKSARLVNENVPAVGAFQARLAFADNKVDFQTFEGEVGGGKFKLGGAIKVADLKNPEFGLHLEAHQILAKRDDSITIRADADVKLDGPLNAAAVTGTAYLVRSRFFKEIDILPITLPGRPKPAPKVAQTGPTVISFPEAPLRDWKFNLALKTHEDDPFLIRGNLANGSVGLDLRLGGTGLAPYLEGTAHIERFVATLPFSNLHVTNGFIAFTKDRPFQPSLDLQAESRIRDYLVHAFIYGQATDPQVQLNSEPPLPYADIVSLLATGTTTSELAGNADALASRAAMLAVKQLYQKVFHKGDAPPVDQPKASTDSLLDRFKFEFGALSNRSTGQDVKASFKVSDQTYLIGEVGVDGNFTGSLRYLLRFR